MDTKLYMLLEIIICIIFSFILVYYYSRRGTNPLVIITAGITWSLNFILIVFLPFDIYYTYTKGVEDDEIIKKILFIGYNFIYWFLFISSWIFIPLIQEYEDAGDFTKKKKFIRSIKNNLLYYGILGIICIVLLAIAFYFDLSKLLKIETYETFLYEIMNSSYLLGLLMFYFLFGYSVTALPVKVFYKTDYKYQIKYLEWLVIELKHNFEKIKNELVEDGYLLYSTLQNFKIEERVKLAKFNYDENDDEENKKINKKKEKKDDENDNEKSNEEELFNSKEIADYSTVIKERFDYLYDNAEAFQIELKKNSLDNNEEPLNKVEDLIKLNRKINKNELDNLRIQIKIRNQYYHWATLSTILRTKKKNNDDIDDDPSLNKKEGLIPDNESSHNDKDKGLNQDNEGPEINEEDNSNIDFIPLKNISKIKIFYYRILRRPFLIIYLIILLFGGAFTLISQIGGIFGFSIYGAVLKYIIEKDFGIFGLHLFIMIPIIFLFSMSIFTFFKLKITGYFYMYKNRQTDSVTLMYFSTNLCRISFSICLDVILNVTISLSNIVIDDENDEDDYQSNRVTQIEKILGFKVEVIDGKIYIENGTIFGYIYKYIPIILGVYVIILLFKIPQKIGKCFGRNIFSVESEDSIHEMKEGHEYFMEINQKYKGEMIPLRSLVLPEDKYNK